MAILAIGNANLAQSFNKGHKKIMVHYLSLFIYLQPQIWLITYISNSHKTFNNKIIKIKISKQISQDGYIIKNRRKNKGNTINYMHLKNGSERSQ